MSKQAIKTSQAPEAIGTYSQAIRTGNTIYFSGQIPLNPQTMELVTSSIEAQIEQVLQNIQALAQACGGDLIHIVKLTIFLTDLAHFPLINQAMTRYFNEPFPARSTIQVSALPKNAQVEIEAIMIL